jgi:DNA polymerase-3 subunit alpha (Gram-positive type)
MPKINSFIFLDFETGGLDPRKHAITEVAAIAIKGDTLEKIDLISKFVKPYGEYQYDDAALKATGITAEEIESGIEVKEVVSELINLFKKSDLYNNKGTKPILIAHNSAFDKGFLIQIFNYCNKLKDLEKYTYGTTDFYSNYQPEMLDSIQLAKMMWGNDEEMTSYKLSNCLNKAGIDLLDAHKAINDTIALKDMFISFVSNMRSGDNNNEIKSEYIFRNHFQF